MTIVKDKYNIEYCSNCLEPVSNDKFCQYCEVHTLRAELAKVTQERDAAITRRAEAVNEAIRQGCEKRKAEALAAGYREELDSIYTYGSDTLSGRVDRPGDKQWYMEAVLTMTRRAKQTLSAPDETSQQIQEVLEAVSRLRNSEVSDVKAVLDVVNAHKAYQGGKP